MSSIRNRHRWCTLGGAQFALVVALWGLSTASVAQGMLDGIPDAGVQTMPRGEQPRPRASPPPAARDERLRMPERPAANYNFLEGCWVSDRFKHSAAHPVSTSTYCFDANGQGTLQFQNERQTCRVAARASYKRGLLRFSDTDGRCADGGQWWADHLDCERGANGIAACRGSSRDSNTGQTWKWTVTFHRKSGAPR